MLRKDCYANRRSSSVYDLFLSLHGQQSFSNSNAQARMSAKRVKPETSTLKLFRFPDAECRILDESAILERSGTTGLGSRDGLIVVSGLALFTGGVAMAECLRSAGVQASS